ncbi:hypothetical protein LQD23_18890 [Chromobacterium violaceum]|uniref:hypothetical protein n=1 Tax=Chromobacterium violaceum TaxID=536 RepID=UPI001E3AF634|nr:hypothetical protein [Chromobacterium violaceum]MCD0494345.1 hypothetical protein [Chromobacterium violaceum]
MSFAFDLRQLCGGYAYYSTFTHGMPSNDDRFEVRTPSGIDEIKFKNALTEMGQKCLSIDNENEYVKWLHIQGWAIIDKDFARSRMPQWLQKRKCIKSSLGSYTDKEICSTNSLKRSYR